MELIEPPEPGVYDVPMEEYHRWDAASNSRLSRLMQSPAHLRAYLDEEQDETPSQRLGRMIHKAVLEPDTFDNQYTVLDGCSAETNSGNKCSYYAKYYHDGNGYCGNHVPDGGKETNEDDPEIVDQDDYETAKSIRENIMDKESTRKFLKGGGDVELSLVWEDQITGVTCKARFDRYSPDVPGGAIVDLKTTNDAKPRQFKRSIFNYGYHRQAAHYIMGAYALDYSIEHFIILAAEKEAPHAVQPYRLIEHVTEELQDQIRELLWLYKDCKSNDHWPAYTDKVQDISIPAWAWDQIETQNNQIQKLKEAV